MRARYWLRQDDGVGRRLDYLVAGMAMVAVTVGVAWLGIRSVLVTAAPGRRTVLSAAELRRAAPVTPSRHADPEAQLEPGPSAPVPTPVPPAAPSPSVVPSPSQPPSSVAPARSPSPSPTGVWL